jgi:hypothetical protein
MSAVGNRKEPDIFLYVQRKSSILTIAIFNWTSNGFGWKKGRMLGAEWKPKRGTGNDNIQRQKLFQLITGFRRFEFNVIGTSRQIYSI